SVATDHSEDGVTNIILHGIEFVIGGYRSCKAAAKYASENEELPIIEYQAELIKEDKYATLKRKSGLKHPEVKKQCMAIMGEGLLGPTRNDKNPKEAIKAAGEIRKNEIPMISAKDYHEMARRIGLGNELRLLEILPKCTLIRTESRGSHYRENYPGKSDHNWLKWGIVKREGDLIKN
ncbi:MAG: hypothetical protein QGG48_02865, partial [Desulfatiglandales bacterium]|nr:hypothetical protein [Desulfatiglandales bacterium]